jgi:hypothetical protein
VRVAPRKIVETLHNVNMGARYARWDKAYRHVHRTLPSLRSYRYPSLFNEKESANGSVSHCVLCLTDLATDLDRDAHCEEDQHKHRVNLLYALQQNKIAVHCAMLQNRMDAEIPDRNYQIPVQLDMYWTLLNCHPTLLVQFFPEALTDEATTMIDQCALKVQMSLLQLAAWKATCMVSSAGAATLDYFTVQDWLRRGWKVNKSATRNSNEIGIILRAVLPFMR